MSILDTIMALEDERTLSRYGAALNAGGQFYGAFERIQAGNNALESAEFQAAQLRQNAGQARAASQHTAEDIDRQNRLVASRALAVAASSGGGASDPTVVNLIARNAAEGAYQRAVAIYRGEDRAADMELQAEATEYSGKSAQHAARMTAVGQMVGAGASVVRGAARDRALKSMYEKYGGGGPKTTGDFSRLDRMWGE